MKEMRNKSNQARIKTAGKLHDYHDASKSKLKQQLTRWIQEENGKKRGSVLSSTIQNETQSDLSPTEKARDDHLKKMWKVRGLPFN